MKVIKKTNFIVENSSFDTEEEALAYIEKCKNETKFKTEEEIIDFLIQKSENLANLYKITFNSDLALLPYRVNVLSKLIGEESDKYNIDYNYHHIYNSLFKTFRVDLAILKFREIVNDVELSDEKIKRIYEKMEVDWCPGIETALEEVEDFIKFARLLAS